MTKTAKKPAAPHCILDKKTGRKIACFRTQAEARAHMRTLDNRAGLGAAKSKAKSGCGCGS